MEWGRLVWVAAVTSFNINVKTPTSVVESLYTLHYNCHFVNFVAAKARDNGYWPLSCSITFKNYLNKLNDILSVVMLNVVAPNIQPMSWIWTFLMTQKKGWRCQKMYQKWYICKFCKYLIKLDAKHYLELRLIKLLPCIFCK